MGLKPLYFTTLGLLLSVEAQGVVDSKLRPKLRPAFSSSICNKTFPDHPLEVWKLGIYEAQIVGKAYEPYRGKRLTAYFLSAQSKSLSKKHNHHSRIWGICKNGTGWVSSWPSPEPMKVISKSKYAVPLATLNSHCKDYRIDFAEKSGGQPKRLALGDPKPGTSFITVDTSTLKNGTMAVTCYPKTPEWQGPVMWYFAPVRNGPSVNVPQAERLYGKRSLSINIVNWINAVREQEGLAPLDSSNKSLGIHAQALTTNRDLIHDRRELSDISDEVKRSGKKLLGENRFRGQSNLEVGWLLWNSPRHRSLILSPKGTHIGVASRSVGDDRFGVILVAK